MRNKTITGWWRKFMWLVKKIYVAGEENLYGWWRHQPWRQGIYMAGDDTSHGTPAMEIKSKFDDSS